MGCLPLLFPLPTLTSGILEQLSRKRVKKNPFMPSAMVSFLLVLTHLILIQQP